MLQPTGQVSPCCWNQEYGLGEVPRQSLKEIWNGEAMQKLRRDFLSGKPTICSKQMRHIGCHVYSRRDDDRTLKMSEVMTGGPVRFDLRLNGKCNLQCVMCDVWKQPNGLYDQSDFWQMGPTEIFPYLQEIDMLGGEPFVQPDTFKLIDMVAAVNSKCTWAFVTNGHYRFGDSMKSRLDKIEIRWLQVSLDSLDAETYRQIRKGGDLSKPLATVEGLLKYRDQRPMRLLASICVQRENWQGVGDFLDYAFSRGIEPILQFAYGPTHASLLALPRETQQDIANSFSQLSQTYGSIVDSILLPLTDSLNTRPDQSRRGTTEHPMNN